MTGAPAGAAGSVQRAFGSGCSRSHADDLKGASKNNLFPRLRYQLRARILMYSTYTAVLRAALPCTDEKLRISRGALKTAPRSETDFVIRITSITAMAGLTGHCTYFS